MKVGDFRPVDIPVLRCPECDVPYKLVLPILSFRPHDASGTEPEWVYMKDCKHKVIEGVRFADDDVEYARLSLARTRKVGS